MKQILFIGFIFGLVAPIAAMFIGLTVSKIAATVINTPCLIFASFLSDPFGSHQRLYQAGMFLSSAVYYALVFALLFYIYQFIKTNFV